MQQPYVVTSIGLMLPLDNPQPHDIQVRDIAHHLAQLNRFSGAARLPISEAQHATIVARLVERISPRLALLGLFARAAEAYLCGRAMTPAARADAATRLDTAILRHVGLAPPTEKEAEAVAVYDEVAFVTEWRDLMPDGVPCPKAAPPASFAIRAMSWHQAEEAFLKSFDKFARLAGAHPGAAI